MCRLAGVMIHDREEGELPRFGTRVVAYSPDNPDINMKYRLMDSQFFKISTEARYWFYIDGIDFEGLDDEL